ncbi:aminopeptidase N [Ixodes scapularis]
MLFREENRSDINLCNFVTANLPSVPKDDDWLILNLRGYGYYRVNYDARNWNLILMELNTYHTNIDVLNRARIIDDLFDLADMSILPYGTALHASEYLRREKEIIPWLTVLKKWQYIEAMLSGGTIIEKWKLLPEGLTYIREKYTCDIGDLLNYFDFKHLRRIHYAWACRYKYAPCVIEARHAFNFFRRSGPRSKSLLVDHQVTVFCTVIEDGGESEWQALYNLLSHASSPTERSNIIVSLGCSKNPSTLRRYFQVFTPTHMIAVPLIFEETARRSTIGRAAASEFILENSHALKVMYPEIFGDILVAVFSNINTMAELGRAFVIRLITPIYTALNWEEMPSDNVLRTLLRRDIYALACKYDYPPCVQGALALFKAFKDNPGTANKISRNHRGFVYCTAIERGDYSDWKFLWDRFVGGSQDVGYERSDIVWALTCSRNHRITRTLLKKTLNEKLLRPEDCVKIFDHVSQQGAGARNITMDFIRRNWPSMFFMWKDKFLEILIQMSSRILDEKEFNEMRSLYYNFNDTMAEVTWAFQQSSHNVISNSAWMNSQYKDIQKWLQANIT